MVHIIRAFWRVLCNGNAPTILLVILIISNGALISLNVWLTQGLINTVTSGLGSGNAQGEYNLMMLSLPWLFGLMFVIALYNLRELLEQVLKIKLGHNLRNSMMPAHIDKCSGLQYWCFENSTIRDLLSRVRTSPDTVFTEIFWGILFIPSYVMTIIGMALLFGVLVGGS